MSRPYYDDHSGGIPQYHHPDRQQHYQPPPPRQRPAGHNSSRIPQPNYAAPDRRRHQQPYMNPAHPTASPARGQRPQQEPHHPEQSAWDVSQNPYDGSGYEDQSAQHDQWPLPAHPSPQPQPQPSPQPHASPNVNSRPRKPPRRPQRHDELPLSENRRPSRESSRGAPRLVGQEHSIAPLQPSHHGNGQWTGDGYPYAAPMYPPPSRPLPPTSDGGQSAIPQYVDPPMPQQAVYGHANRRPPLGPPPSARRGPPNYYPQVGPVHPIAEETDSMRGSVKTGSVRTGDHNSKTSFASSAAIPIGIPRFYVEDGSARPSTGERSTTTGGRASTPIDFGDADDQSVDGAPGRSHEKSARVEDEPERDQHSPVLVRQASLGKRSKPTLVTQKGSDQVRKTPIDNAGIGGFPAQKHKTRASEEPPPVMIDTQHGIEAMHSRAIAKAKLEGQAEPGAPRPAQTDDSNDPRDAFATVTEGVPDTRVREHVHRRTPEDVLRSGTGLLDASDESDHELKKKRSRELLGSAITKELYPDKARTRSPLAPSEDQRVQSILDSLEKGGALSPKEADELKKPMGGLSDRSNKRRPPPRLDVDAVRDAEARGSLTSLPDLIRRATKLASNLDRGKTASRLGMGHWLEGAPDAEKRRSGSISDMLNAFPPPNATPPPGSRTGWRNSYLRHTELPSDSDADGPKKSERRFCGMPLWVFVLVMILLFLLVAAAIVVPVMLLVYVPNQNKDSSAKMVGRCEKELTCENGGANVFSSKGLCECLCTNGYTGPSCLTQGNVGCVTTSVGSISDATVGQSIPRLLKDAYANFSIPLAASELLGQFSQNNMTCGQQNALVTFDSAASKRSSVDIAPERIDKRQDPATTKGLLFASATPTATSSPRATSVSSGATSTTSVGISKNETNLDFARVAVLYILEETMDINQAADAQVALQAYFRGQTVNGDAANPTNISLGSGTSCSMDYYEIVLRDGTTVGGGKSGNSSRNSTSS